MPGAPGFLRTVVSIVSPADHISPAILGLDGGARAHLPARVLKYLRSWGEANLKSDLEHECRRPNCAWWVGPLPIIVLQSSKPSGSHAGLQSAPMTAAAQSYGGPSSASYDVAPSDQARSRGRRGLRPVELPRSGQAGIEHKFNMQLHTYAARVQTAACSFVCRAAWQKRSNSRNLTTNDMPCREKASPYRTHPGIPV